MFAEWAAANGQLPKKSRFTIDDIRAKVDLKLAQWREEGLFLAADAVEDFFEDLISDLTEDTDD